MDPDDLRPVYMRIAEELRDAYEPGGRLPSTPQLAEQWGVAKETVRAALDVLKQEGIVVSWQGRGTFYRVPNENDAESADAGAAVLDRLDAIMGKLEDFERRLTALEQTPGPATEQ